MITSLTTQKQIKEYLFTIPVGHGLKFYNAQPNVHDSPRTNRHTKHILRIITLSKEMNSQCLTFLI